MNKVFKFVFLKAFGFRKVPEPNSKIHIILRFPILKVKIYLGVMRLIPLHSHKGFDSNFFKLVFESKDAQAFLSTCFHCHASTLITSPN